MRGTGKVIWCCVMVCGQGSEAGEPADRHDGLRQDGGLRLRQEAAPRAEDQYAVRHARVTWRRSWSRRPATRAPSTGVPTLLPFQLAWVLHGSSAFQHVLPPVCGCDIEEGSMLGSMQVVVCTHHAHCVHAQQPCNRLGGTAAELLRGCKHFLRMRYMPPTRNVLQWLVMQVGSGRAHLRDDCWLPALP